jgi:hypothetical protein
MDVAQAPSRLNMKERAAMNETQIISDDRGDMTLMLHVPAGTLRIRLSNGPGRVVQEAARRRRAWSALVEIAGLARSAETGDVIGVLLGDDGPTVVDGLPLAEGKRVALVLRRCRAHLGTHGLPPAGTRVSVDVKPSP